LTTNLRAAAIPSPPPPPSFTQPLKPLRRRPAFRNPLLTPKQIEPELHQFPAPAARNHPHLQQSKPLPPPRLRSAKIPHATSRSPSNPPITPTLP
jgi:hypothetical protein